MLVVPAHGLDHGLQAAGQLRVVGKQRQAQLVERPAIRAKAWPLGSASRSPAWIIGTRWLEIRWRVLEVKCTSLVGSALSVLPESSMVVDLDVLQACGQQFRRGFSLTRSMMMVPRLPTTCPARAGLSKRAMMSEGSGCRRSAGSRHRRLLAKRNELLPTSSLNSSAWTQTFSGRAALGVLIKTAAPT